MIVGKSLIGGGLRENGRSRIGESKYRPLSVLFWSVFYKGEQRLWARTMEKGGSREFFKMEEVIGCLWADENDLVEEKNCWWRGKEAARIMCWVDERKWDLVVWRAGCPLWLTGNSAECVDPSRCGGGSSLLIASIRSKAGYEIMSGEGVRS